MSVLLLLVAAPASAQLCRGGPSFTLNPYQVAGLAAVSDEVKAFGGDFGVGGQYFFATAGFASRHFDATDSSATDVSGRAGAEFLIDRTRRVYFCPLLFLSIGNGPDAGVSDRSTFHIGAGVRAGVAVHDTPAFAVVPTFGIDVLRERLAVVTGEVEDERVDGVGIAAIGVGFILRRQLAITPELRVPFSAADSDVTVGVRVALGF